MSIWDFCHSVKMAVEDAVSNAKINMQIAAIETKEDVKEVTRVVSGKAAIEDNNASIRLLNRMNEEMKEMYSEAKRLREQTKRNFNYNYQKLIEQREDVFKYTLPQFIHVMSRIKKVDFGNNLKIQKGVTLLKEKNYEYETNFMEVQESYFNIETIVQYAWGGFVGVHIGNLFKAVELEEKIQKAATEKEKLKAQCEKVRMECVKVDSMKELCKSANETIRTLNRLTQQSISQVRQIILYHGDDYSEYTSAQKDSVMLMCNFSLALNDLVCTEIFDEKGNVVPQFEKFVGNAKEII